MTVRNVTFLLLLLLAPLYAGCSAAEAQRASAAMHSGLNATTDLVSPNYELAVDLCHAREMFQVDRAAAGTITADVAEANVARIREVCDAVFESFLEVRAAQLALRAVADALKDGRATASDLLRSSDELQGLVTQTRELLRQLRYTINDDGGSAQ